MEENYADRTPRKTDLDILNSVCDKYQDIVHNCTVFPRPSGKSMYAYARNNPLNLVIFSFIYTRLKYIYNCQNVRLTSSDAIMAYAFIQVQDVTERTIAGMEVTKLIAQVRYNIILKRTTPTFHFWL